jgi:hypothetical protein
MYNIFSTSSSHYFDEHYKEEQNIDNICIICWLTPEYNNNTVFLQDIYHISTTCNCNPYIHLNCFNSWIDISSSCPICRKEIFFSKSYIQIKKDILNYCISFYFLLIHYLLHVMRILTMIAFLNFTIVISYNIYFYIYLKNDIENNYENQIDNYYQIEDYNL